VGVLEEATAESWSIRRRDGSVLTIGPGDIEAHRIVPPGRAQRVGVDELERIAAAGWRALETAALGDWLLRAAGGVTGRANSALCLGSPGLSLADALHRVETWYAERGLPPKLHLPLDSAHQHLVDQLSALGWSFSPRVHVMTAELAHVLRAAEARLAAGSPEVTLSGTPDEAWLATYRQDRGTLPDVSARLLANHPRVRFVAVPGVPASAIARVVTDGRWAGLFAVEVGSEHRRRGLATLVTDAALREAGRLGARQVYLQVSADNSAAIRLYERLNFAVHHDYAYAEPPAR
jgi:ribosomal protein S18 acetylase RimI-like enzyme